MSGALGGAGPRASATAGPQAGARRGGATGRGGGGEVEPLPRAERTSVGPGARRRGCSGG